MPSNLLKNGVLSRVTSEKMYNRTLQNNLLLILHIVHTVCRISLLVDTLRMYYKKPEKPTFLSLLALYANYSSKRRVHNATASVQAQNIVLC
jgi:hypothetical protein